MPAGRASLRIPLLLAALLVASAPAHAAKDAYARGLKAAGDGNWAEAEARMREALAEDATPVPRALMYGRVFEPYVPQYFLGIAAYKNRGDCTAALRNLQHQPTRAAVADSKARPRLSKFEAAASQALRACEQQQVAVTDPPKPDPVPPKPDPVPPKPDPVPPKPDPVPPKPDPVPPKPDPVPPKPDPVPPKPEPVEPAVAPAPAALVAALDNFLRGRYVEAASVNPAALADAKAKFHALLLRAASRHTLAQVAGDPGNVLIGQATADVRAAKALQPAQRPDENLYSPRFRKFYTDTR